MAERAGQVALIIGGTGALGSEVALKMAAEGADVAFTYRTNETKARDLSAQISGFGSKAHSAALNIEDAQSLALFVEEAVAALGRIDTLVYAAGPSFDLAFISKIEPGQWGRIFDSDVKCCFNAVHASIPHLRNTSGSVVAITAAGVERAIVKDILSLAPKAAITALIRGLALEEGRNGIRANCVAPGYIQGGIGQAIMDELGPEMASSLINSVPLRRMGTAAEVADAVSYLSSTRASYVTGTTVFVSGGMEL